MNKTVYVIYLAKENRPAVMLNNYGSIVVYLNEEAAEAYVAAAKEDGHNYVVRPMTLTNQ